MSNLGRRVEKLETELGKGEYPATIVVHDAEAEALARKAVANDAPVSIICGPALGAELRASIEAWPVERQDKADIHILAVGGFDEIPERIFRPCAT